MPKKSKKKARKKGLTVADIVIAMEHYTQELNRLDAKIDALVERVNLGP